MGSGSAGARLDVVRAYKGNKFVSMAGTPVSFERGMTFGVVLQLVSSNVSLQVKSRLRRIRTKFVFGTTLKKNEVSTVIYEDFLPQALADGRYVTAREPYVIGTGLECIQTGLEAHMKGVSARKVVVTL